jgi:hypothetical protein
MSSRGLLHLTIVAACLRYRGSLIIRHSMLEGLTYEG